MSIGKMITLNHSKLKVYECFGFTKKKNKELNKAIDNMIEKFEDYTSMVEAVWNDSTKTFEEHVYMTMLLGEHKGFNRGLHMVAEGVGTTFLELIMKGKVKIALRKLIRGMNDQDDQEEEDD